VWQEAKMAVPSGLEQRVEAIRRFNRFYTRQIGVLDEGLLQSPFSLAEARVLYELAHRATSTAAELRRDLGLDPGYLSRILGRLRRGGLAQRKTSTADGRQGLLSLTARGRRAFATLDGRSRAQVAALLGRLSPPGQGQMVVAMGAIERLLGAPTARKEPYLLRPHQPGDMGWVVHRHGALYAQEYGWDETFEALVASIVAGFIQRYDPRRERCWIAEKDGEVVGSVFLVKRTKTLAQLRLLLVEPQARGLGLGQRLVDECVRFARQAGYKKMMLWTNDVLHAARRIYERAGFRLVHQGKHRSFGHPLVEQTWELKL
jgi:DNA-binding MarR family transcriptional regulator/GNAT superfamily N-acetyltransferase